MNNSKVDTSNIKAIFFDAGGTLLYPYPSVGDVYDRVAKKYGCKESDPKKINDVFKVVWNEKDGIGSMVGVQDEKSEKNWWYEIVKEVFSRIGKVNDFDLFFEELYDIFAGPETWRLYDEVHDVLQKCREKGWVVGMISNWDSRVLKLCKSFDIEKYFDFFLISALFGKAKPHPEIFKEALKISKVEPHQALHVGDSLEDDVFGAKKVGLEGVWLDRHARKKDLSSQENQYPVIENLSLLL